MNQPIAAKAVTYRAFGGEDVIEYVQRSVRVPQPGEVRIRVRAAAVNPTDVLLRDPGRDDAPAPLVPGMDAAGTVEAVGQGVSRLRVGDEVMAAVMPVRPEGGAQATFIVVPEASAVAIPKGSTSTEASTLPMNGLTALLALDLAGLERGQVLAVSGGAGTLAHYAIATARHRGLKVVSDAKASELDLVRGYGADIVVERSDDFAGAVRAEVPEGAHALLDTALLGEASFGAIRDGGVYMPVRGWSGTNAERGVRIKPVFVYEALERTDWLEALRGLVESGGIKLLVAGQYPPERVGEAHRALMAGGLRGRPVIVFSDE